MNASQIRQSYGKEMVYRIVLSDGKRYKFIADDGQFVKDFFSLKGRIQSMESLREPTEDDFSNLKTL